MVQGLLGRLTANMRFPQLFAFTGTLFVLDVLVPDLIPFVDELLLGLLTLMLATWRKERPSPPTQVEKPQEKDITPANTDS